MVKKELFIFMKMNNPEKKGTTLVEAMLAMVIMLILVVAGGAFLVYSSGRIATERNKRVALEVANSRLEELRVTDYDDIKPGTKNYNLYYIKKQGGSWKNYNSDPGETININALTLPITTTVQYIDGDGVSPDDYDYLRVVTRVGYRLEPDERVALTTYIGQYR